MDLGIAGKVALVTGASKGLGLGVAAELAAEGARVAINSRSRKRIDAAAVSIGAHAFEHDAGDVDRPGDLGRSRSSRPRPRSGTQRELVTSQELRCWWTAA
jgi:NAD(P)-dependent dehydrogenase (short-subunit alcohol dehydrogenase family)